MIDKTQFEELVIKAINELPDYFRQKMENITIHVEDIPDRDTLKHLGYRSPYSILGLYQGVPMTRRGIHYRNVMPDRIIIYRKPILRKNNDREAIKNDIKKVVLHEIGHYFGLSEHELSIIEKKNIKNNRKKK